MDKFFSNKNLFKKMLVYTSAAMLFTAIPTLPASAAENTQIPGTADIPAPPESQPSANNVPAEAPDASSSGTDTAPTQNTETPLPQLPADAADTTLQLPADAATVPPVPEPVPADQGRVAVTPMQSTVYAASPKGLNVRSGPSTSHIKLGTLKYGDAIAVTGITADNWYQIQYSGGVGYILADYVSATPLTTETPTPAAPAVENPPAENPVTPDTAVSTPDTGTLPDESLEDEDDEMLTEEDTFTGNPAVTGHLIGTPVLLVLGLAIVGIMALIGYTVYSLFKKEDDATDEYGEDDYYSDEQYYENRYYEDGQYDEYYENEQYADSEYYGDGQYSVNEYCADEQYTDDEYYADGQYPDDEYYENEQYPDSEYYEDEQYSDDGYYENGQYPDNNKKH